MSLHYGPVGPITNKSIPIVLAAEQQSSFQMRLALCSVLEPVVVHPKPLSNEYRPTNLQELVRGTPMDLIRTVIGDLDSRGRTCNGRRIEPVPSELTWARNSDITTEVIYTLIRQTVQIELENFARRVDHYYILTPRTLNADS